MDYYAIEVEARTLLGRIYRREMEERPGFLSPMQMIEPEVVASHLGYELTFEPSLGNWGTRDLRFEIAGLLDQQRRIIRVSLKFRHEEGRFTAAHELGHAVLAHPGTIIHRDRPVFDMPRPGKDRIEKEADYFAACLLAPRRLIEEQFERRFGLRAPLPLTDAVAFNLCGESAHALMRAGPSSYKFAAAVASARSFNGDHFRSLAETFNISVGAMAIRLRELGLIEE
ncbi:MAG TPA: ImmA/IrrE family metallo-endopeptidase [Ramlibacter sp.]|uniref:ImmA/IrrE family metallo-endopeptidase n=1 Tax=Ramlibacter sp. TaxID=1917967 RepID=UPI002ED694AE